MSEAKLAIQNYLALRSKVDAKFEEIWQRHSRSFACKKGCHSCCQANISVSQIERDAIVAFVRSKPELISELKLLQQKDPHQGQRCQFLSAEGECKVYEARPLICRSHGAPISFVNEAGLPRRDVCALNFTEQDILQLDGTDFFNIDTLNTILAAINAQLEMGDGLEFKRYPLSLQGLEQL